MILSSRFRFLKRKLHSNNKKSIINNRHKLRTLAGVVGLSFFSLTATLVFLNKPQKTEAAWWESSWRYRQRIAIEYSGATSLGNYQILLNNVNTSALVTAGKLQSDCDDLRFAGADGNSYDYWIESGCNTTSTDIWVEVSKITAPLKEIYMYYGNPSAPIGSNGEETFVFFDDFESNDFSNWNTSDSWTIVSDQKYAGAYSAYSNLASSQYLISNIGSRTSGVIEMNVRFYENNKYHYPVHIEGDYILNTYSTNTRWSYYTGSAYSDLPVSTSYSANTWYKVSVPMDYDNDSYTVFIDGSNRGTITNNARFNDTTEFDEIRLLSTNSAGSGRMWIDNIFLREYSATEPTINAPSTEEVSKEPILHLSFDEGYGTTVHNSAGAQPPRDPVAYWKMDETSGTVVRDATANGNDGTMVNGPTRVAGRHGQGLSFDGVNDYVEVADSNVLEPIEATFSMWVNPAQWDHNAAATTLLAKRTATSDGFLIFYSNSTNTLNWDWGGSSGNRWNTGYLPPLSAWTQLSFVRNSSGRYLYVNGVLFASTTSAGSSVATTANMRFGMDTISSQYFYKGVMDEVKIYDYALTSEQIQSEYMHTNGMMINMTEDDWVQGLNGTALDFDGSDDQVNFGNFPEFQITGNQTYEFWINPTNFSARRNPIAKAYGGEGTITIETSGTMNYYYGTAGGNASPYQAFNSLSTLTAGTWQHVAVVRDFTNSKLYWYINGVKTNEATTTYSSATASTLPLLIGDGYTDTMLGQLDELKIYPYARTLSEIKADYNAYKNNVGTGVGMGGRTPSQSSTDKPVLWYDFNDGTGTSVFDRSGNGNHGLMTNMDDKTDYVPGKYGKSLDFDGSNDYVNVNNESNFENITGITVSAWVRRSGLGVVESSETIASKYWDGTNRSWKLSIEVDRLPSFLVSTDSQNDNDRAYGTSALTTGQWYYVTGTWSSATGLISLYVDGVLQNTTAQAGSTVRANNSPVWVARDYYNNSPVQPFPGQIDEVKVYDYARTPAQIHEDMNGSPIAYWKFDEGYGTTANDTMGNYNGTLQNMDANTDWVTGKFAKSLDFDGSNDYVSTALKPPKPVTLSAWINLTAYPAGTSPDTNSFILRNNAALYFQVTSSGKLSFFMYNSSANNLISEQTLNTGEWYHVVATWDGTTGANSQKIYINGILDNSNAAYSTDYGSTAGDFTIGAQNTTYNHFNGQIDETKVYNYVLTADEIKAESNSPYGNPSFGGTSVRYGTMGPDDSAGSNLGFTMPEPVAYWNFDEGSGTTAQDVSENGNTGTLAYSPTWVTGKYGKAIDFESSSNQYVSATDSVSLSLTGSLTISAWIKPESTTTATQFNIAGKWDAPDYSYMLAQYGDEIRMYIDSGSNYVTTVSSNLSVGNWYHIIGVYNATSQTVTIYINGTIQTNTVTGTIPSSIGDDGSFFHIGAQDSNTGESNQYDGIIDEVKVYNTNLTPTQLAWEYNKGKPIFHMKMDQKEFYDCDGGRSGTATVCESIKDLHGSTSGSMTDADWISGKYGNALDFDGTDDYIELNSAVTTKPNEGSVSFWAKTTSATQTCVLSKSMGAAGYSGQILIIPSSNVIGLQSYTYDAWRLSLATGNDIDDGNWHQYEVVFSSSDTKLYVNGSLASTGTANTDTANWSWQYIGAAQTKDYGANYIGQLDDVRIYNYARTEEQVRQDYLNGASILFQ